MEKRGISVEKICVLMTSYNPKKYILDQVKSIIDQKDVLVDIVIRDDASTDLTWLNEVMKRYPQITVIRGKKNLGVIKNVWQLIDYANQEKQDYDFFAYSDQDDVWMPDKLTTGINVLKKSQSTRPNLYYTNLLLTDQNLNPNGNLFPTGVVKSNLGQGLAQIFEFACTSIFNKTMVNELATIPKEFMQFDHLIYYMAIIRGKAYFDNTPYIYYRQHGENVSGNKKHDIHYILSKLSIVVPKPSETDSSFKNISKYLLKYFEKDLTIEQREIVFKVANYKSFLSRIKIICDRRIRAGYQPKDFYRMLRLLVGKY